MGISIKDVDVASISPMMQHQFYKLAKKSRKHKGLRGFFI